MKYDFTTVRDRQGQGSQKWRKMLQRVPDVPKEVVPLSVADMEFVPPPELVRGLQVCAAEMVYGYPEATPAYYNAVCSWMKRRHRMDVTPDWIVESPGVVPALYQMVRAFTKPGDGVAILTPGYHPFFDAVLKQGRRTEESPLRQVGNTYEIDFDDLEVRLAKPETTLMILCNPHNPVGRVWTREELEHICEMCLLYDVFLISDEIHLDLILPGYHGTSVGAMEERYVRNCAICTAPSKTFNIAGLQVSNLLIADGSRRAAVESGKGYFSLNMFAYQACRLAYNECEPWLDELLCVLDRNRRMMNSFFKQRHPNIRMAQLQGTYLAWLDCRALGMTNAQLEAFFSEKAYWFISPGEGFGEGGSGFVRVNIACPEHVLRAALERLDQCLVEIGS